MFTNWAIIFFIHGNIRSPSVNFDNLYDKLSEVYFLFSLFALTGTKIMLDKNLQSLERLFTSISLFHSLPILMLVFLPVMFLIVKVLKSYLTSINQLMRLKSFGLKCMQNTGHPNFLCGVIYRHSNSNMNDFMECGNVTIDGVKFSS